jgi:glycosyltransferase involved in cell wall biosynthesis
MRVALVASSYLPERGRLERRVDELARGLAKRGAQVEILTQGAAHRALEYRESVIVRRFPTVVGPLRFPVAPKLRERLRVASRDYDVVDVHTRLLPVAMAVASARVQRLVITPGVPLDTFSHWRHAAATRAVIGAAMQVVCLSEVERSVVSSLVPEADRRTQVLPDGVDVAALRAAEPFDAAGVVVLSVDRLDHATNVGRAIAAMPGLGPEFQLVVIGDGPARARLSAFAADLRISSRVRFVGAISDELLFRWLRTARVVVTLPSERGTGSLITEACAAGVAVVASDLPIHRQTAERPGLGQVVFVAPRGSPLDVADAIEEAARLPLSPDAAFLFSSTPSWDAVTETTWKLYQRMLGHAVDSEPEHAASGVVDLRPLQNGRQPRAESVTSGAGAGDEQGIARSGWHSRRQVENRTNGAPRWP